MIDLEKIKINAKNEINETKEKVVKSFLELIEKEIYDEIKRDIAVNGDFSLESYNFTIPFNSRRDDGFETKRSSEYGLTCKELIDEVKDALENKGYVCEIEGDEYNGEPSILSTKLMIKE